MKDLQDFYKNKKVLITGGGGFIGSNLAINFVNLGAKVSIMDSKLKPYGYNEFNLDPIKGKYNFDSSDIRDKEAVLRNVKNKDIIFNLAAQVGEGTSEKDPFLDFDINIKGHINVLESLKETNPSAKIVFAGSRLQYGKTDGSEPIKENHSMNPVTPYAKNKMLGEMIYKYFHDYGGLDTVSLRIANPFGERAAINNPGYCVVNWFIGRAILGKSIPIYGEGTQIRDYIYIDDIVNAITLVGASKNSKGKFYNVGSGIGTKFKDMAQTISDLSGSKKSLLEFIEWPPNAKNRETGNFTADITKIKNELGWEPKWSLEEGLKKTMNYYKKNGVHYTF